MLGFLSFDREAEQYLCAAVLRPGKAVAADGTLGLLCRLLPLLRAAFPRARFLVRLDGGFATPEIFDFLDAEPRLDYVVAMAKNAVLQRHAESAMQVARAQSEVGGETAHVYQPVVKPRVAPRAARCPPDKARRGRILGIFDRGATQSGGMHRRSNAAGTFATGCYTDTRYAARTWDHERRVVIKAEVVRAAPTCFLGGMGRSADGAVAAQPSRPSCPPPVGCSNPGSACRRRCPRPIPAPITPFGGRIWTFMNNSA